MEKRGILIVFIAFIQIFLILNNVAANSYIASENPPNYENKIGEKDEKNSGKLFNFLIGLVSIKQIGVVSAGILTEKYQEDIYQGTYKKSYNEFFADTENKLCCEEMGNGAICQNVPADYGECVVGLSVAPCEEISDCVLGCCFDSERGFCSPSVPRVLCENAGGEWDDKKDCEIEKCQEGCCVLGGETYFTTLTRCGYLGNTTGFSETFDFRGDLDEVQCIALRDEQEVGACVKSFSCSFGTELECAEHGGVFYKNYLCSHPDLETNCERQKEYHCVEGEDEIFWFDSCGNRENIYSADKERSWNGGYVLSKERSCNPDEDNINSDCGNCDYYLGSKCGKTVTGDYKCQDLNCVDEFGKVRKNGESWCDYDAYVGDGKDLVGSRYWKYACVEGEVIVEPCADYRQEVCAEEKTTNEAGEEITTAACRTNRWKNCFSINNDKKSKEEKCEEDSDCFLKEINIGDFSLDYCMPKYPTGLRFWEDEADEVCSNGDQTCEVIFITKPRIKGGGKKCVANCECLEPGFAKQMNDFCVGLGDCGAYINYEGVVTEGGYSIYGAPGISNSELKDYKDYAKEGGDPPEVGNSTEDYEYDGWNRRDRKTEGNAETPAEYLGGPWGRATKANLVSTRATKANLVSTFWLNTYTWLIFEIVDWICGGCLYDYKKDVVKVYFHCKPWKAPTGDQRCDDCNDDPLRPCSEYRCNSLGAACKILNPNTQYPICIEENPNDNSEPVLTIGEGNVKLTHEPVLTIGEGNVKLTQNGKNIEVRTFEDECIPAWTPIEFNLNSNEPASCRYSIYNDSVYSDMQIDFVEGDAYVYNHTFATVLPSLASFPVENVEGELYERLGDMKFYVKCEDSHGNFNKESYVMHVCVSPEPDDKEPEITAILPRNNHYVGYGINEVNFSLWLIEPAECRYDTTDNFYNQLRYKMNCSTEIWDVEEWGWPCRTILNLDNNETNNFYFRCKDQPWLSVEEDAERNVNSESFTYSVLKSSEVLKIDSVSPSGVIETGFEPIELELEVETSGGAENGKAICDYNILGTSWAGEFFNTNDNEHSQLFSVFRVGEHTAEIYCEDVAGNNATTQTSFSVELDDTPPQILRVFNQAGNLKIITDEEAECYYSPFRCQFKLEDGEEMTSSGFSKEHSAEWNRGERYYIKCADVWGNANGDCAMRVMPT